MIVAVTGSSGFIGRKLVKRLTTIGCDVIKIDVREGYDILDWNQLKNIPSFDVLVHLAAYSFVPLSYEKPREFYNLNVNGVINGLELCRQHDAKFVFASSYVYGKPKYLPIDENHPKEGFNPYSETKLIGEKLCHDYFKYFNQKIIILRPFNIYGEGQGDNFLVPMIVNQAKTGTIKLLDPRPKRDFIFVDDVVEAFVNSIVNENIKFEIFNVGSGKSYSVKEVVDIVNNIYGGKIKIEFSDVERKNEVMDTVADISKAKSLLKWQPKYSLIEGLKDMIMSNE